MLFDGAAVREVLLFARADHEQKGIVRDYSWPARWFLERNGAVR